MGPRSGRGSCGPDNPFEGCSEEDSHPDYPLIQDDVVCCGHGLGGDIPNKIYVQEKARIYKEIKEIGRRSPLTVRTVVAIRAKEKERQAAVVAITAGGPRMRDLYGVAEVM